MITVYTKTNCPACDKTKAYLRARTIAYDEVHLDEGQEKSSNATYITRDELLALFPEARTMPQIVVQGVNIGGYKELMSYTHLFS